MNAQIQATTVELQPAERRQLEAELTRTFARYAKEVLQVVAHVSRAANGVACGLAVQTAYGSRFNAEGAGETASAAIAQAAQAAMAGLQRDILRRNDPRLNRNASRRGGTTP
jgi:hypothetical protein